MCGNWQVFFFSNTFHFYCNLFCYLLTYLFTYLFFYFLLCINVVDLLSIKKKKKKKRKKKKKKNSLQAVSVDEKRIHRNKYSWICEWQPKQWRFSLGSWRFTVFLVWFFSGFIKYGILREFCFDLITASAPL